MSIVLDGTTGITTPGLTNTGTETIVNLTTTGNTILGDASTDTLNVGNGGLVKDASGNVGIGTTVNNVFDQSGAARPLLVQKSDSSTTIAGSTASITISNGDTTTSNTAQLNFAAITGASTNQYSSAVISAVFGARTNGQYPAGQLAFSTSATGNAAPTERMRIDSSGNVGIGTSSPAYKLDVSGAATATPVTNGIIRILTTGSNPPTGYGGGLVFSQVDSGGTNRDYSSITGSRVDSTSDNRVDMVFSTGNPGGSVPIAERMRLSTAGALVLAGSTAQKATGTTWSNPSDQRLKDNIRDYTKGTSELMQVRVREWEYNGKGGTTEGMKGLGVIADEVMTVLPNTVETYDAKLNADDEEKTEIKKFDATEITWLLVKTVQEQQALITTLTARITALENK
jgi:hypothetical protein